MTWTDVKNEDLVAGDTVRLWGGVRRITRIAPYTGPLRDIIFAIAETTGTVSSGFSLERGGYTETLR